MMSRRLPTRFLRTCPAVRRQHTLSSATTSAPPRSTTTNLKSILIANRGEIALRVSRTAHAHGIRTVTLYTDPDRLSQHASSSPFSVNLGPASAYLHQERIIAAAKQHQCDAVHPGYGFLSENPEFARRCTNAGLTFIGPPGDAIEAMGDKAKSKEIMIAAGVPCIPGYHGAEQDPQYLAEKAAEIGYPVLLKAVRGGGGKGMRIAKSADDFQSALNSAKSEAKSSFDDETMLVEKYIQTPRHIEVQVFADMHGNCVALGERDCSLQRRHQKIIEESPAPNLDEAVRQDLWEKARAAALAVGYTGAGTVEFIFDNDTENFYFMEMNTRLQVEHPVTEMVTGEDLVEWQIRIAEGGHLSLTQDEVAPKMAARGHAFEARIYAENPDAGFVPDSGRLIHLRLPAETDDVRIDRGFVQGDEISSHYDPMIAKLIVRGDTRQEALQKLKVALEEYEVVGPVTNIEFLKKICVSQDFVDGKVETGYIEKHRDELFFNEPIDNHVWAQTALGVVLQQILAQSQGTSLLPGSSNIGFGLGSWLQRRISLQMIESNPAVKETTDQVDVDVLQKSSDSFDVKIGDTIFENVLAKAITSTELISHFPSGRIQTTVIQDGDVVSVFQSGKHFRIRRVRPKWMESALGIKDVANTVHAPMPCKILRVEVKEGDEVTKDQPLVIIESMKMESVIRSPQNGRIQRIVHRQGDVCKAGTALVEFEANSDATP